MPDPAYETSPDFCESDADVNFLSCDKVIFKVHSKYLVSAGGFPPSEFAKNDEIASLSEDSETLTYLFTFLYPRRNPELKSLEFEVLYKLAEAAEKYEVFSAMTICKIRLEELTRQKPLEMFLYSYKHGYEELLATTATLLLGKPLIEMTDKLPADLVHPWIKFHEHWRQAILRTFTKSVRPGERTQCELCVAVLSATMFNFYSISQLWDSKDSLMETIQRAFLAQTRVHITFEMFKVELEKNLGDVSTFDKFLRNN